MVVYTSTLQLQLPSIEFEVPQSNDHKMPIKGNLEDLGRVPVLKIHASFLECDRALGL